MNINWKMLGARIAEWKVLGKQTINRRLFMLLAILIGGFAVVATAYLGVVVMTDRAEDSNTQVSEFGSLVDRIQISVLQARREEKDFFARRKEEFLAKHDKTLSTVYGDIEKAAKLAPDEEAATLLDEVRANVRIYQGTFRAAAEAQKRAGYDESTGLQGTLSAAVQEVEANLDKHGKIDLTASMLKMRRFEKDFIQRRDFKIIERMTEERKSFTKLLARADFPGGVKGAIAEKMNVYHGTFLALTDSYRELADETEAFSDAVRDVEPILSALVTKKDKTLTENRETYSSATRVITLVFIGVLLAIAASVAVLVLITSRSITNPLQKLTGTIAAITAGDRDARAKLVTGDEMQQLGDALDRMMDERGKFMQTEAENEKLNNSVISILRSVSQLGRGDLTIKVPVNEDITGALGDAINHMSDTLGKTLSQVNRASEQVVITSKQTREITMQSRETVLGTARGMNEIRATIQETAKRIKRLGERSQEIGGIVKLIDTIAERTNMLALNANMQAAQAGEAGRGFMVVAAEVQRLAESAKEATHQIGKLVNNIQLETGDTIAAMDKAIEEVVEGSELAEVAATQIKRNEEMVATLDALGAQLLEAVRSFNLPSEYLAQADGGKRIKAVA